MDIKKIKQYIFNNNEKIEYILSEIGCKNIVKHDKYYSCANYDGDNNTAINQYFDNEYLNCENHTRDIKFNKSNKNPSIIDLVCFNKKMNIFNALKYLCDLLGLDYYALENEDDIPESIKVLQMLYDIKKGDYVEYDGKIQPITEKILSYYKPYGNEMFSKDNISFATQKFFEIGYDDDGNYITIPIRDELGNLVGVKGRVFDYNVTDNKYIALEKYSKSKILYGLDKAIKYIKKIGFVYIVESEKAVMQLFDMGVYNCVATGGKNISPIQKNKLMSLGVPLIFCYDKDVSKEEIVRIAQDFKGVNISMILDTDNILDEKESPTDNPIKWKKLIQDYIIDVTV